MPQQINKKFFLFFFVFLLFCSLNNKNVNKFELPKIQKINISGLNSQNTNSLKKKLEQIKSQDLFFLKSTEIQNILNQNNLVEKSFNIPSKNNTKYKLMTKFPKDFPQDETYEFFIIVASKKKLDILSKQNIIDFNKRLSRLGRSNWEMKRLGYTIMRD